MNRILYLTAFFVLMVSCSQNQIRHIEDFNANWKFQLGDDSTAMKIDFDDTAWRTLNLPHDWSIEGAFSDTHLTQAAGGFLPAGIGWYRKTFQLSDDVKEKHVAIQFDGVYRRSEVWINGHYLGKRPNGYISFQYDLTRYLKFGEENVLAVKVDNSLQPNSRWYTGSGIYRNVKLISTGKTHIKYSGYSIATPSIDSSKALVGIEMDIVSFADKKENIEVRTEIYNNRNIKVASEILENVKLSNSEEKVNQALTVTNPALWSIENPYLYKAKTEIYVDDNLSDTYESHFGFRYFRFDVDKGFFLNGKPIKIHGVNDHHDLGALGAAINTRAIERELEVYKEMGCNAIRTAHNPPAPELLDLCDEMGFLVMDEAFDEWKKTKAKKGYHLDWDEWHVTDLVDMIKRDRNHPSIIMWSIGNEIPEQFDTTGIRIAKELVDIVKSIDTIRPVTCALTENNPEKNFIYQSKALDILSFNYKHEAYKDFQKKFPGETMIAAENMSALATRGHYDFPSDSVRIWPPGHKVPFDSNPDYTISAYDNVHAYWGSTHEASWDVVKNLDYVSGLFIWSGFDYLGEPIPYNTFPARSSYYGVIDLAGFPKDAYYLYQSEWTSKPVLHLFPHWNWEKDRVIDVWVYYNNADEVELIVNGQSLGNKSKKKGEYHVMWRVPFAPGSIRAISRKDGQVVLEKTIKTAGQATKLELSVDRDEIAADGYDLSFVTVKVLDRDGNFVPLADNLINFSVEGEGFIAGVDNGYQASLEPFKANYRKAYNGMCLVILQNTGKKGTIKLAAASEGLESATIEVKVR